MIVVARLDVEQLDLELGADLDAVLLSAGLDDCVHGSSGLVRRPRAAIATSDMERRAAGPRRERGVYGGPEHDVNRDRDASDGPP